MATPSKNLTQYAETLPVMRDLLKDTLHKMIDVRYAFDDLLKFKVSPSRVVELHRIIEGNLNRILEVERKMENLITTECATVKQALLYGEDEVKGLHRPEAITINSSFGPRAPKLTPRVGYEEATNRLNSLKPKNDNNDKISIRQLAWCLGQRGSESHIIEFWTMAKPEDKSQGWIKTNGVLNLLTPDGMVYWAHAKEFVKRLYENYYVGLLTSKIIPISTKKGKWIRFL